MYDVIIIGMGMSGITAGIYAKRAGLNVLMFEKGAPGGILQNIAIIKNYPGYEEISGVDLSMQLFKQVKALDIPFKFEEVLKVEPVNDHKIVTTKNGQYECKNVIIATGRKPKYLGLDNEQKLLGRGISTCATCDGFLYKGQDIAVVGSGNSALSEALYLSNLANKVYLLHRGREFKGEEELVSKVTNKSNIEIHYGVNIKKYNEENGKIQSITLDNDLNLNVSGVFIYIGYKPDTEIFGNLNITNLNGDILVDEVCLTEVEGIYAIGDCIKKGVYQLVTAAAEGAIAVSNIDKE